MQTRDMWDRNRWKVVAGAATLSALGIAGLAVAAPGDGDGPRSIDLEDRRSSTEFVRPQVATTDTLVNFLDLDSPFDDSPSPDPLDSPDSPSPDSPDSPDPEPPVAPDSPDSPDDTPAPAPVAADSPDSVDSSVDSSFDSSNS